MVVCASSGDISLLGVPSLAYDVAAGGLTKFQRVARLESNLHPAGSGLSVHLRARSATEVLQCESSLHVPAQERVLARAGGVLNDTIGATPPTEQQRMRAFVPHHMVVVVVLWPDGNGMQDFQFIRCMQRHNATREQHTHAAGESGDEYRSRRGYSRGTCYQSFRHIHV